MGCGASKPKTDEKLEDDLVFANEKANGHAAPGNGAGVVVEPEGTPTPVVGLTGSSSSSGLGERGNKVYESPAMSVMGTPLVHLPNFAPADASILQQAATQAQASRLRDGNRSRGGMERGADGGDDLGMSVDKDGKPLDKRFGYQRNVGLKYDLENEIGRGHFGHTCLARGKKGELKGKEVAIKIIPKAHMTNAVAVDDVKREVKILRALNGMEATVKLYDTFEDQLNVYIAMELCDGGELLEHLLRRGGRYTEPEAKSVIRQILGCIAFCHLQGVVHRDLKPENFLYKSKDEGAPLRVIDFGLSDYVKPGQRLNDIVGSAYYIAPEVLHRAYGFEADVWSIGVICYILLSGARPFWARTESGIFRAVLRFEPNFQDAPWPTVSHAGREFVKSLLTKDYRRRPTAAQALTHPWLRGGGTSVPLDMAIYRSLKSYYTFTALRRAGLKALVPTLTEEELVYLRAQYAYFDADSNDSIDFSDLKKALTKMSTDAMKESQGLDMLKMLEPAKISGMDFREFCAATVNVFQLEIMPNWPERARLAYQNFLKSGKANASIDDLIKELGQVEGKTNAALLEEWTNFDGTISFLGYTRLIHGPSRARSRARAQQKPKERSPSSSGRSKTHSTSEMGSIPEDGAGGADKQGDNKGQAGPSQPGPGAPTMPAVVEAGQAG